ncbi:MAG: N-acetyltransferase [Candidatus Thermoplasmatota archaeon]|nr:N-acetyltransferase [Candidatus Thermoplasmatota archaeon]
MNNISRTALVHENVELGSDCIVEDFVVIGARSRVDEPHPPTIIGDRAVIRSHTVIYAGNTIGDRFQTGNKANIRESNEIGDDVSIGTLSILEHHIKVENGVRIHSQVFVPEYSLLEEGCWLGPNVVLTNARYPKTRLTKVQLQGPTIGKNAKVGANSTILPGVKIGEGCLIGAGALVVRDTVPQGLYLGNPARRIGWVCSCGLPLKPAGKEHYCSDCGKKYREGSGSIKEI